MSTVVRADISRKNKYWISKHRYYELKHFCLQYKEMKKAYKYLDDVYNGITNNEIKTKELHDPTSKAANRRLDILMNLKIIETAANESDNEIGNYIFKAVTEGLSFETLKTKYNIPCGKDMYYDRYRKFFWILSQKR